MKILYYDCFSGISGDMNLGALLDLGVDPVHLIAELSRLGLEHEYRINICTDQRKGITGQRVEIKYHDHDHDHDHHHHHEDGAPSGTIASGHEHRSLSTIEKIIETSSLAPGVKRRSLKMFDLLAEAEGKIHGMAKQDVHFHEVGAIDSILDIVGAAVCLEYLQVEKIICSAVELGGGFVKCQHGLLPVPAPAVMELLRGVPVKTGRIQYETTTPTGAVILAANVDEFTERVHFIPQKVGYGIGRRDTEIPNVLRVFLGEYGHNSCSAHGQEDIEEKQILLETNIDDMNPEFYEYVEEKLFAAGALDVYKTPVIMKKGRPAVKLSVLSLPATESALKDIILKETSAIGLRSYSVNKTALMRVCRTVETVYGPVGVKFSYYYGKIIKYKAEYKDCKTASENHGVPLQEVYREIARIVDLE